jgi:Hint module
MSPLLTLALGQNDPAGGYPPRVVVPLKSAPRGSVAGDATNIYVASTSGELYLADIKSGKGTLLNRGGDGQSITDLCIDSRIDKTLYGAGGDSGVLYAFDVKGTLIRTYQLAPPATSTARRFISSCIQTRYYLVVVDAFADAFYRLPLDDYGDLRGKPPPLTAATYQGKRVALGGQWTPAPSGKLGPISVEWSSLWFGTAFVLNSGTGMLFSFPINATGTAKASRIRVKGAETLFVGGTKIHIDSSNELVMYVVMPGRNAIAVLELVRSDLTQAKFITAISSVTIAGPVAVAEYGEWIYSLNGLQPGTQYTLTQQLRHTQAVPANSSKDEPFSGPSPGDAALPAEVVAPESVFALITAKPPRLGYKPVPPTDNEKPAGTEPPLDGTPASGGDGRMPVFGGDSIGADDSKSSCFPAAAEVTLESGHTIRIDQLGVGDRVLAAIDLTTGANIYSSVFLFTHRDPTAYLSSFVRIYHTSSPYMPLTLTSGHYLYINGALAAALTARVGDTLYSTESRSSSIISHIESSVSSRGLYNPQTADGRIVVDGVVSSTYTTAVHPRLAAALLVPLRWTAAALGMRWSTPANRLNLLARGACGLSWVTDSMPRGPQRLSSAIA